MPAAHLGSVDVAADGSPVQRRSAASVRAVHGSSCLQQEMYDNNMVGARSPEAVDTGDAARTDIQARGGGGDKLNEATFPVHWVAAGRLCLIRCAQKRVKMKQPS